MFSLFTLMMAVRMLRRQGLRLTHDTLRRPFYGQCFTTAPFALMVGIGTLGLHFTDPVLVWSGRALNAGALCWYMTVQTLWFSRRLHISLLAGFVQAAVAMIIAAIMFIVLALLIV